MKIIARIRELVRLYRTPTVKSNPLDKDTSGSTISHYKRDCN